MLRKNLKNEPVSDSDLCSIEFKNLYFMNASIEVKEMPANQNPPIARQPRNNPADIGGQPAQGTLMQAPKPPQQRR